MSTTWDTPSTDPVYRKDLGDGRVLLVERDQFPIDPRTGQDNPGRIVGWHDRYHIGDRDRPDNDEAFIYEIYSDEFPFLDDLEDEDEWRNFVATTKYPGVLRLLYMNADSDVSFSTDKVADPLSPDTGHVGYVYMTPAAMKEAGLDHAAATKRLQGELEEYQAYVNGDVFVLTVAEQKTCDLGAEHRRGIDSVAGVYLDPGNLEGAATELANTYFNLTPDATPSPVSGGDIGL